MITWDDFDKIWASTSPLTPYSFSDPNYAQGWNFIGSTPPARQMWDSIQKQNDEKFKYLRDNFGTPNIVTQASQMTDTDKVYVYLGSEAGWNSGHWYYYDEGTSSWADGGVYNSVAFVTDTTLSIAGQPADAKATGDALALKSDLAGCTFTGNVSVNADLSVTGDSTLADTTVNDLVVNNDLSVAGDSSLVNLSVSGTTALAGTSTAPTQSADDNSTKIATTEYVQTELKPIETKATIDDKRISNIEKLLQGNLYDYQTDTDSKYTKTVLAGAMPYASLDSIGGKTLAWNQLVVMSSQTTVRNGITYTITSDGTVVINGTSTAIADYAPTSFSTNLTIGHVYWLRGCPADSSASTYFLNTNNGQCYADGLRFTADSSTSRSIHIRVESGVTANNVTFKVQCTDLTLMFGTGNEPTLDECKAMFPAESYPYNAGQLLSAGVTSVVSNHANLINPTNYYPTNVDVNGILTTRSYGGNYGDLYTASNGQTTAVPLDYISKLPYLVAGTYTLAVDEADAYIRVYTVDNAGNVSDYIAEMQQGTNKSATFTLASNTHITLRKLAGGVSVFKYLRLTKSGSALPYSPYGTIATYTIPAEIQALEGYGWSAGSVFNYIDYEAKKFVQRVASVDLGTLTWYYNSTQNFFLATVSAMSSGTANVIVNGYVMKASTTGWGSMVDYEFGVSNQQLMLHNSAYSNENAFTSAMSGVYAYYELATPVEVDISQYLTDDNLISVEAGGSLTFPNANGDDYQIPVPSSETYMVDLQASL